MDDKIRLGRVAGIRITAHWSLVVIAALIGWSLAVVALPRVAPGYPGIGYWLVALVTTVAFFQSLLAHELAHCIVGRRAGMRVDGIVFWLLGGASRLEGPSPSPAAELRVAVAGPAASAVVAASFLTLAHVADAGGAGQLLSAALWWLGTMNALLAAFNLLPAYPLDGGRALRAILWRVHGDYARATVTASRGGWLLGAVLIAGGILDAALRTDLSGLWLVPMGWFLCGAARAELPVLHAPVR